MIAKQQGYHSIAPADKHKWINGAFNFPSDDFKCIKLLIHDILYCASMVCAIWLIIFSWDTLTIYLRKKGTSFLGSHCASKDDLEPAMAVAVATTVED